MLAGKPRAGFPMTLLFAVLIGLAAPSANAQETFVDLEAGISHLNFPKNQFFVERLAATATRDTNLDTAVGDATGGYLGTRIGANWQKSFFGSSTVGVAMRVSLHEANNRLDTSATDNAVPTRLGWFNINDTFGAFTANSNTLHTSVSQEVTMIRSDLVGTLGYGDVAGFSTRLYAGPSYLALKQDTDVTGFITDLTGAFISTVNLTETIDTDYLGGVVGIAGERKLNETWSYAFDAAIAYYRADTRYDANQPVAGAADLIRNLSKKESAWGGDLKAGVDYRVNHAVTLGLQGGVNYLSYAPQIDYGDAAGSVLRITGSDLLGWTGGLRATVALN